MRIGCIEVGLSVLLVGASLLAQSSGEERVVGSPPRAARRTVPAPVQAAMRDAGRLADAARDANAS